MNIIQFDSTVSLELLNQAFQNIKKDYPEIECIAVPKGIDFMADIDAETLFQFADNIAIALERIKEERPEEYQQAYKNRMIILRDKQWKEALKKANNKQKRKKNLCDTCTVPRPCPDDNGEPKEKCVWYSRNPGGI